MILTNQNPKTNISIFFERLLELKGREKILSLP